MDLPGWQALSEELKDKNVEIISVAEDTGGEAAAGQWFDKAKATFTQIVDEKHLISSLYNMVNVPTAVWINEDGIIVRPNEVAYSRKTSLTIAGKTLSADGESYVAAIKDWAEKGAKSEFAMAPEEVTKRLQPRSEAEAEAEAAFQLGVYFHETGKEDLANVYWEKAQAGRPDSWNYHRQDWSFTPAEAQKNWMKKFMSLGDKPYYAPLAIGEPKAN